MAALPSIELFDTNELLEEVVKRSEVMVAVGILREPNEAKRELRKPYVKLEGDPVGILQLAHFILEDVAEGAHEIYGTPGTAATLCLYQAMIYVLRRTMEEAKEKVKKLGDNPRDIEWEEDPDFGKEDDDDERGNH